jgi:epoxyqueuosine reductase
VCVEACPGGAVRDANWWPGIAREELFDPFRCRETVRRREEEWGVPEVGCGVCIAVCPHTRAYLARSGATPPPAEQPA